MSRAVASTMRMVRSGAAACGATGPHAERLQRGDGTRQQRAGAVVGRRPPRDQRGFDPGLRQRNGRGQAGGAPADDRGFHG